MTPEERLDKSIADLKAAVESIQGIAASRIAELAIEDAHRAYLDDTARAVCGQRWRRREAKTMRSRPMTPRPTRTVGTSQVTEVP